MREGWPSLTAVAVAVARGIGTDSDHVDPIAPDLLPPPLGRALRWVAAAHAPPAVRTALRVATLGMVDHVSLRRAAIDEALEQAIAAGATQLVVLGAGLDARPWRLATLRGVTVFEVDHPATQRGKQRRVAQRPALAADVRFVAVDFERDALAERLASSGHDPTVRTAWIWEGVTPYLHPAAIEATLADVGDRSAPGSRLLVTYAVPELVPWDLPGLGALTKAGFAALGESLYGAMTTEALAERLAAHGLVMREDSGNAEWAVHHPGNPWLARVFSAERLAVAEKVHDA
ncbi:class I SAM-dependent methyltransferase [Paraliomyxa miuraensis]|uniref:class I SAM-dependent methyltransferase n=1 Tax=Paraliomyxa miuraensis TaxID=376150 RepID=UPI002252EC35|nr:SAM-dependent methyltransferase [Paraliomyxa miuraensis]MCX4246931.1 SAM-dependent methyltransferase [Paraliomyxa miuraensis]